MLRHIINFATAFLLSQNAFGQQFIIVGKMVEVDFLAITCIAKKIEGYPRQVIIRTNHPDLLFADMEGVNKCVYTARLALVTEPQTHKPILYPRPEPVFESVLVGNMSVMECMIGRAGGRDVMVEFSFPWLVDSEYDIFLRKQFMKMCLDTAKPPKAVIGSV